MISRDPGNAMTEAGEEGSRLALVVYALLWLPYLAVEVVAFLSLHEPLSQALLGSLGNILPQAILGLGVLWVCARIPWPGAPGPRFLGVQLLLAAAFASLATLGTYGYFRAYWHLSSRPDAHYSPGVLAWQFLMGLLIYGVLAGAAFVTRISRRLRVEESRAAAAAALQARAELRALRAQLDPHFLFNTLHTLLALVRHEPGAAEEALEQFGDLLRYVLGLHQERRDEVPLREEWEFVRNYVALERLRLGERLRVREELDDGALSCVVPAFTMQPLVENAIRHGIAPRAHGGTLTLRARRERTQLLLQVADDGPGVRPETLADSSGLGLRLVRQRLEARHGSGGSFEVRSAPGEGFEVTLRMPSCEDPEEESR